jgi:MFS family permease
MQPQSLLTYRVAVSAFFFVNGFLYANWTARLPELQQFYGLDDGQLGTVLFFIALGSMVAMPAAGWLGHRLGSHWVVRVAALLFCACIPLVAGSQNEWVIRACFFGLGATSGAMDVAMNSQAVQVERLWGKVIFSSFHAAFSIGMALGAATGGLFAGWGVALILHLTTLAGVSAGLVGLASLPLRPDVPAPAPALGDAPPPDRWRTWWGILPLGLVAFCCMTGEGGIVDWSALFMHKVVGQNEVVSAWAFGTFGVAMTVGRLLGDYAVAQLGRARIMAANAALTIVGLGLAIGLATIWSTFLGLFMVGLGVATIVPTVFSLAGNLPGVSPSVGISMVTSIGYAGFFVGPPTIGYLAQAYDLRLGLGFVWVLFVLMAGLIASIFLGRREPGARGE